MLTAVVGINWGDEGKGRMVDLLSERYDIVCRYQGGNNAGHTVVNERGKFILNLLPSGILRDETVNVMGPGMVIDTEHLFHEVERLREGGIQITPRHLKISDRASVLLPWHREMDELEEMGSWSVDRIFEQQSEEWQAFNGSSIRKETLGNVAEIFRGKNVTKKVPNGNVGVINISNIGEYALNSDNLDYIDEEEWYKY